MTDTLDTISADALAELIEERIFSGELKPGERLPSTRATSAAHGIAPGTVARAYRKLVARGLLSATVGRGTFVAGATRPAGGGMREIDNGSDLFARAALTNRWLFESRAADGIQLMGGYGDVHKPLGTGLIAALQDHGAAHRDVIAELHPPDGAIGPRETIAGRLGAMMGRDIGQDQIILGDGAHAFLDMTLRALTRQGDTILAEHPTYYGALDLFGAHRLKVIPVERGPNGLDLDALDVAARTTAPRLFYFTGNPSTPRGHVLSAPQRQALLALLKKWQLPTIEDSALWPFMFDGRPDPPLANADEDGLVILICSLSKWFFPSLRFAAAIGSGPCFDRLRMINRGITRISPAYPQFAIADYLADATFERDLAASIAAYAGAGRLFVDHLQKALPRRVGIQVPTGGFTVWLDLPETISASQLYGQCLRLGVYPLLAKVFALETRKVSGMRLAFGQNTDADLLEGAQRISRGIELVLSGAARSPTRIVP